MVNEIIKGVKNNDISLYNYIDRLTVEDAKTGVTTNVRVVIEIGDIGLQLDGENAHTKYYNRLDKGTGKKIPVKYKGLEGALLAMNAPINDENKIGFNIIIFDTPDWADVHLANEIGDVMYRMEYPKAAQSEPSDFKENPLTGETKLDKETISRKGSASEYSKKVENTYKDRKKSGEGKNESNNPYPLKTE